MMNKVLDMSTQSSDNNKRIAKNTLLPNSNLIVYEAMYIARMLK